MPSKKAPTSRRAPSKNRSKAKAEPAPKPKRGRPRGTPKFVIDPVIREQIVGLIHAGVYPARAARAAGVTRQSYANWIAKGEAEEEGPYRDFFDAIEVAVASAAARAESNVFRDDPAQWLRHMVRDKAGEPGWSAPIKVDLGFLKVTAEELAQKMGLDAEEIMAEAAALLEEQGR